MVGGYKERTFNIGTRRFKRVMVWTPRLVDPRDIISDNPRYGVSRSNNDQKQKLWELLEMFYNSSTGFHHDMITGMRTIVRLPRSNHRIDNQSMVTPNSLVNLQYQIGSGDTSYTYAGVLIRRLPTSAPPDLLHLIIYQEPYGFTPNQVMGFINDAFKYSAEHRCNCDISWYIEEERDRSPSRERPGFRIPAGVAQIEMAAKVATKVGVKSAAKGGLKVALKKVPVVGLLCGGVFAAGRLLSGDPVGAGLEVASGAASLVPGGGTVASLGVDALILARDAARAPVSAMPPPMRYA